MSPACRFEMTLPADFAGVFGVTVRLMSDGELTRLDVAKLAQDAGRCRATIDALFLRYGWARTP